MAVSGERIKNVLETGEVGTKLKLSGWVRSRRDSKAGLSFIELNDGSCLKSLQVLAKAELEGYEDWIKTINTGAAIEVEGVLVESPGKEQRVELEASMVTLLGGTTADYPLQKKRHSFEFLREIAHLRPRTNAIGAVMRVRHALSMAIHDYFRSNDFFYVHTPIITASDCEGAGEMFRVSTLDAKTPPLTDKGQVNFKEDFFGRPTFLTVSGQLQAEIMAMALGRVYTFGPTFRAENSNTARHVSEFWMIEPEMAFVDLQGNADIAEDFLRSITRQVLTQCEEDMGFFDLRVEKGLIAALQEVAESPFERITYTQAIEALKKSGKSFEYKPEWGPALQTEHERYLTEELFKKPVIVTDYPAADKAFYMRLNDDGKTVRAMDVLVPRIGEIIGGSQREERYDVLLERLRAHDLPEKDYWWYMDLRQQGSAPHSGFGLGFERMLMFLTGMKNVRDVILAPRTPKHADY